MKVVYLIILGLCSFGLQAQSLDDQIGKVKEQIQLIDKQKSELEGKLEQLKLAQIRYDLKTIGLPNTLPGDQVVQHLAYTLAYVEKHEQARWVAHVITPDVITGTAFRSNDFRPDSLVSSGSAVESDYFLKKMKPDSSFEYDAFGYDRGHLAPSADFRWSAKALSESYYYSNMSPQLADFNRGSWAALEDALRNYIFRNPTAQLYVVTGPILEDDLPRIEKGTHKVSIPKFFWKVACDLKNKRAIGFLMPNRLISEPLETFAVTVDEVEKRTGLNFFSALDDGLENNLEAQREPQLWVASMAAGDVEPLDQESLPRGFFNTIVAQNYMNQNTEVTVVGNVVGARLSRAGNLILNLDKQFPNQVFSVFVRKEDLPNFSYKGEEYLKGKTIAVKGRIISLGGTATMYVDNEKQISFYKK